jgi:drug/metabolite transporter (DMT)-like permease
MTTTETRTDNWKYIALIGLGAFCYSTLIIFTRLTEGLDAMTIAFFRAFFAFLLFLILVTARYRQPLEVKTYHRSIPMLIMLGAAVGLTAVLYVYAIQHTTAANASLLVNSAPIYIAFLAPWLLKEKRPRYTFLSLGLLILGVIFITGVTGLAFELASIDGILAGVASGFTYSLTFMVSRHLRGKTSSMTQSLWSTGAAALLLLPFALRTPGDVILHNLVVLVPLGMISLGLSSFLYYIALQKVKAQVVSVVAILEPVSGVLIGLLLYQEFPGGLGITGILLIIASIYLISR